ncbi:MAG: hypothetical protein EZS26_001015 [Candidatus Ordinivivax streblomastigis]|uniref:Uncharacterized protein n=1 Tax=Candidatus Ordinivivax streblomastigis TaxID=2540710 RepID=A0A5M8P2Z2_9BACT|nr:MAG: hypothetical protein EZS26_001015 [Candidatus Ordinivivax streblomastigis]
MDKISELNIYREFITKKRALMQYRIRTESVQSLCRGLQYRIHAVLRTKFYQYSLEIIMEAETFFKNRT